jgi:hypothetical protein
MCLIVCGRMIKSIAMRSILALDRDPGKRRWNQRSKTDMLDARSSTFVDTLPAWALIRGDPVSRQFGVSMYREQMGIASRAFRSVIARP